MFQFYWDWDGHPDGSERCGSNPSVVYLKRGEKSRIEYWTGAETPQFQLDSVVPLPAVHPGLAKASGRSETQTEYQKQSERQLRTELSLEQNPELLGSGISGSERQELEFRTERSDETVDTTALPIEPEAEADEQSTIRQEDTTIQGDLEDGPEFRTEATEIPTTETEFEDKTGFRPESVEETTFWTEFEDEPGFRPEESEATGKLQEIRNEEMEETTFRAEQDGEPEFRTEEYETATVESGNVHEIRGGAAEETTFRVEYEDEPEFRTEEVEVKTVEPENHPEIRKEEVFRPESDDEPESRLEAESELKPEDSVLGESQPEEETSSITESSSAMEDAELRTEKIEETSMLPDFRTAKPDEEDLSWTTPWPEEQGDSEVLPEDPQEKEFEDAEFRTDVPDTEIHPETNLLKNEELLLWTTSTPEDTESPTEVHPEVKFQSTTGNYFKHYLHSIKSLSPYLNPVLPKVNLDVKPEVQAEVKPEVKSSIGNP